MALINGGRSAIVKANWRKSCPEMPGRKAVGTNTAMSTTVMLMTGAEHLLHRLDGASLGGRCRVHHDRDVLDHDDRVIHHDADRHHQAEEHRQVEREAHELPEENVPMIDTGIASIGISDSPRLPRKMITTASTSRRASKNVW